MNVISSGFPPFDNQLNPPLIENCLPLRRTEQHGLHPPAVPVSHLTFIIALIGFCASPNLQAADGGEKGKVSVMVKILLPAKELAFRVAGCRAGFRQDLPRQQVLRGEKLFRTLVERTSRLFGR